MSTNVYVDVKYANVKTFYVHVFLFYVDVANFKTNTSAYSFYADVLFLTSTFKKNRSTLRMSIFEFPPACSQSHLRVLGSPNPGQSFGRGLSGPQATEVRMDPVGSWAAVESLVHSAVALRDRRVLGPSTRIPH